MVVGINVHRGNDNIGESENYNKTPQCSDKLYSYEDALILAGHGRYSYMLLGLLSLTLLAMGLDMFGFSVVVTGCSCEFHLTQTQKGILNSMPFAGPILMYTWGYISDTRGRRTSLQAAMAVTFIFSALSSLAPNWIVLGVLKLIATSFVSFAQSPTYALLGESCSEHVRGYYLLLMTSVLHTCPIFYYSLGYFVLGLDFSYDFGFTQYTPWRLYTLVLSLAPLLGFLSLLLLVESPKFLANQGREDDALKSLEKIWIINGGEPHMYPVKRRIVEEMSTAKNVSLARSLWEQTAPLFKPPYLKQTLVLYYITAVIYGSSNSLVTWLPLVANAYFGSTKSADINGLCHVLSDENVHTSYSRNITDSFVLLIFLMAFCGCVGVMFLTEPLLAVPLYVVAGIAGLGIGLVSSYYVILLPTSYRGMAACLGVLVARVSALAGINLVAAVIHSSCQLAFASLGFFILTGAAMARFLPPDTVAKVV